jgi:hypothetical protein
MMSRSLSAFNLLLGTGSRGNQEINVPRVRKVASPGEDLCYWLMEHSYSTSYIDLDVSRPATLSPAKLCVRAAKKKQQ